MIRYTSKITLIFFISYMSVLSCTSLTIEFHKTIFWVLQGISGIWFGWCFATIISVMEVYKDQSEMFEDLYNRELQRSTETLLRNLNIIPSKPGSSVQPLC